MISFHRDRTNSQRSTRVPRRSLERHPCGKSALMPRREVLRAATPQLGGGRGIVRCQTLLPSETGSQTFQDVAGSWSLPARQGGIDLPGMSAVRPVPNCPIIAGAPSFSKWSHDYYIQGGSEMKHRHRFTIGALVAVVLAVALALIASGGQGALAAPGTIYVDAEASGDNDGSSWDDAFTELQSALDVATAEDQIWVADGTYKPATEHGGTGDRYQVLPVDQRGGPLRRIRSVRGRRRPSMTATGRQTRPSSAVT